jgi:hypothetical protein
VDGVKGDQNCEVPRVDAERALLRTGQDNRRLPSRADLISLVIPIVQDRTNTRKPNTQTNDVIKRRSIQDAQHQPHSLERPARLTGKNGSPEALATPVETADAEKEEAELKQLSLGSVV